MSHKLNKQYHVITDREQCISLNQKKDPNVIRLYIILLIQDLKNIKAY